MQRVREQLFAPLNDPREKGSSVKSMPEHGAGEIRLFTLPGAPMAAHVETKWPKVNQIDL